MIQLSPWNDVELQWSFKIVPVRADGQVFIKTYFKNLECELPGEGKSPLMGQLSTSWLIPEVADT